MIRSTRTIGGRRCDGAERRTRARAYRDASAASGIVTPELRNEHASNCATTPEPRISAALPTRGGRISDPSRRAPECPICDRAPSDWPWSSGSADRRGRNAPWTLACVGAALRTGRVGHIPQRARQRTPKHGAQIRATCAQFRATESTPAVTPSGSKRKRAAERTWTYESLQRRDAMMVE